MVTPRGTQGGKPVPGPLTERLTQLTTFDLPNLAAVGARLHAASLEGA